jgi:putative MATE family efflux protein
VNTSAKPAVGAKRPGIDLTQGSVGRHMVSLGSFLAFGNVAIVLISMADVYFVSRLGSAAVAALSFTFPVYLIITAFSSGLGNGVVAVVSRAVGAGDQVLTRQLGTDALLLTVIGGLTLTLIGYLTIDPLFTMLGADDAVLPLVKEYMHIWYLGVVLVIFPQISQTIARAYGDAKNPSIFMWSMCITNIVLDPILIFGLGPIPAFGLKGAAIAALISRCVYVAGMLWLLHWRLNALASVSFNSERLRDSWGRLLHIGIPAMATQMVQPVSSAILTKVVALSGTLAVAAYGIGSRFEMITAIYLWAAAGAVPSLVGQNVGARRMDRVQECLSLAIKFCLVAGAVVTVLAIAGGRPVVDFFAKSPEVADITLFYVRVIALSYVLGGLVLIAAQAMNALRRPLPATGISMARTIGVVPFALAGHWAGGIYGVFIGIAVGASICGAVAWLMLSRILTQETARVAAQPAAG